MDVIYTINWSICGYILGSVLAVLGWRYWAGGRLGGVKTVARGRVEAVTIGSDCWVGYGGLYKLSYYSSLALVNKKGKASGAFADKVYINRACLGRVYADKACVNKACMDGAYTNRTCIDKACMGKACMDGACMDKACAGGVVIDKAYIDGAYVGYRFVT